jgi:hypothetical protein
MKRLLTLIILTASVVNMMSQGFNGTIDFRYTHQKDTTMNVYSVKNKKVRLDQFNKKNNTIEGSYLFDFTTNEVKFLTPKRKLWGVQKSETPPAMKGQCVVAKGNTTKTIVGVKCTEYTVKNSAENTVITYWIADGKYTFFAPLLKLWNGKDRQRTYYSQIKNLSEGSMPLLSEEKQLTDGKLLTRLEVVKISSIPPDDSVLEVPKDYTKFGE